jgi:hypothetical protein
MKGAVFYELSLIAINRINGLFRNRQLFGQVVHSDALEAQVKKHFSGFLKNFVFHSGAKVQHRKLLKRKKFPELIKI